ncbi:hypothetical protein QBC43DRAFT_228970 [Cladorrhinum sp. PSN259]|nr:hypothetical protein QBC43DRAFT_228970 [Cladorrhinum sp. PSN259]
MAAVDLKGIFPPTAKRHPYGFSGGYTALIKDSFTLPTLLLIGALIQTILTLILPPRIAIIPLILLLGRALFSTVQNTKSIDQYLSSQGVFSGRLSAQLPKSSYNPSVSSPYGSKPASEDLVVFHLGARVQHPLGPLSPQAKEFGEHFSALNHELLKEAKKYGCIDLSIWNGDDRESTTSLLGVYYFKNIEGLNRFAVDPMHRKAWDWFSKFEKAGGKHLGIFHETFEVKKGGYETLYVNMHPTLLGRGAVSVKNEESGEEEWVRTLVDAGRGYRQMKGQYSRMGR